MPAPAPAIPANDFRALWAEVRTAALAAVERTGESGWLILGKEVKQFETALAGYWGLRHAVGTGNGMDAIEIALRAAGFEPGEKVLTTPLSAFATTLAIIRAGGIPVFCDTDETGLIDLGQAREMISAQRIRWLIPVHLYGHCLDLERLAMLRDGLGVKIIEDCAQSIGAAWHGSVCGSAGLAAATSFYPTKNLGAFGDGGALLTDDETIADKARSLRHYGQSATYEHSVIGMNSRLDELQAAILHDAILPRLPAWTQRRREIAERYLSGIQHPQMAPLPQPEGSESVWHLFPVAVSDPALRGSLLTHLKARGIAGGIHYPKVIPDQPAMQQAAHEASVPLTNARRIAACEVSLPIHPLLKDEETDAVIAACNEWKPQPE